MWINNDIWYMAAERIQNQNIQFSIYRFVPVTHFSLIFFSSSASFYVFSEQNNNKYAVDVGRYLLSFSDNNSIRFRCDLFRWKTQAFRMRPKALRQSILLYIHWSVGAVGAFDLICICVSVCVRIATKYQITTNTNWKQLPNYLSSCDSKKQNWVSFSNCMVVLWLKLMR